MYCYENDGQLNEVQKGFSFKGGIIIIPIITKGSYKQTL